MNKNSIAVFTTNIQNDYDVILKLKAFFEDIKQYSDFMIFSDHIHNIQSSHVAILQPYHLRFFQGSVVFLHINDYLANKNSLCKKFVVLSQEDDVDGELLYDCHIITMDDNQISFGALI